MSAQDALRARLVDEAKVGRTTPSAAWQTDYDNMKYWRGHAGTMFRHGDYLHAEYAARNAALAARSVQQTEANTVDPRLVEAGQVLFFNIHPQAYYTAQPCINNQSVAPVMVQPEAIPNRFAPTAPSATATATASTTGTTQRTLYLPLIVR